MSSYQAEKPVDPKREQALKLCSDLASLFPQNDKFMQASSEVGEDPTSGRLVAVKKTKMNAFNDRDGIQFYALREIQIMQALKGCKHVCEVLDVFYQDKAICIVTEHLPDALLTRPNIKAKPSESDEETKDLPSSYTANQTRDLCI